MVLSHQWSPRMIIWRFFLHQNVYFLVKMAKIWSKVAPENCRHWPKTRFFSFPHVCSFCEKSSDMTYRFYFISDKSTLSPFFWHTATPEKDGPFPWQRPLNSTILWKMGNFWAFWHHLWIFKAFFSENSKAMNRLMIKIRMSGCCFFKHKFK